MKVYELQRNIFGKLNIIYTRLYSRCNPIRKAASCLRHSILQKLLAILVTIKCLFDFYSVCYELNVSKFICSMYVFNSKLLFHFRYTVSVRVEEKQPYRQRTYTWCWSIPFRCSKYKIRIKTIYRTEVSKNISATIPNFSSLKYAAFNLI